jgi:hypothetical protein
MPTPRSGDLGIALPRAWRRTSAPDRGVLVAARAAAVPVSGFRPELVLRSGSPTLEDLAVRLHDFALEDEDAFDLLGHDVAYRRFAHRVGVVDVLCDQWAWLQDERDLTLTCSVAREDYWDWCDVFEAIAETVEIRPRAA